MTNTYRHPIEDLSPEERATYDAKELAYLTDWDRKIQAERAEEAREGAEYWRRRDEADIAMGFKPHRPHGRNRRTGMTFEEEHGA